MQTESNHDTALTLACAGGHEELVSVLIARGANIEHRDKKGKLKQERSLILTTPGNSKFLFGIWDFLLHKITKACKNAEFRSCISCTSPGHVKPVTVLSSQL